MYVAQCININIITVIHVHVITTMVAVNFLKFCFRFVSVFLFVLLACLFFSKCKEGLPKNEILRNSLNFFLNRQTKGNIIDNASSIAY